MQIKLDVRAPLPVLWLMREARVHPLEAEPERDVTRVQDRRPHLRDRRLYREVHGATLAEAHPIDASDDVRPDTQLPDRAAA